MEEDMADGGISAFTEWKGEYEAAETDGHPTDTWSRLPERKVSISVSAPTHTTSSVSTRCCLAPVPIDCKLECVVLGESPTELSPVLTLVKLS